MPKFFDDVGTPVWLPVDFDMNDVAEIYFRETVDLDGARISTIWIMMDSGMEIEKRFSYNEYPAAIESWQWFKRQTVEEEEEEPTVEFTLE